MIHTNKRKALTILLSLLLVMTACMPGLCALADELSVAARAQEGMTLSQLAQNGSIKIDVPGNIPLKHFNFVSLTEQGVPSDYNKLNEDFQTIHKPDGIGQGELAVKLPRVLERTSDNMQISYVGSYVTDQHGVKTQIYYAGLLKVGTTQYVYYVTDEELTDYTVYSVLRENEKILVEYQRSSNHEIEYQFWDANTHTQTVTGPDGWTLEQVFGEKRVQWVPSGTHAELNVKVPRGYECEIKTYHDNNEDGVVDMTQTPFWQTTLGGMQEYKYSGTNPGTQATIDRISGPEETVYTVSKSNENITTDVIVVCEYKKINTFNFNAYEWYQQQFAYKRIVPTDASGNPLSVDTDSYFKATFQNTAATQQEGNTYTWYFRGITAQQYGAGGSQYTWELDQLEINDYAINVPTAGLHVVLDPNDLPTRTTTLPTGTVVTVTITGTGGNNGSGGYRNYKVEITNCFEDITITGGNMVSHSHREVAMDVYTGVKNGQYYLQENNLGFWSTLHQNTLAARTTDYAYTNPFRFQRKNGYYGRASVTLTDKNGNVIQQNSMLGTVFGGYAIQFLVLKPNAATAHPGLFDKANEAYGLPVNRNPRGFLRGTVDPFDVVDYENWTESWDGYYYFRMTEGLNNWMKEDASHGVVLLSIEGVPLPGAIDYITGADETGETAPKPIDVINMPSIDLGGPTGYDCTMNNDVIIASHIPQDRTGQFIFSHWEALKVTYDGNGFMTGTVSTEPLMVEYEGQQLAAVFRPSQGVEISSAFDSYIAQGFCWSEQNDRFVITLRAVWVDRSEAEATDYEVRFYIDGNPVQDRLHAVPEGALVVTDLYQTINGKQVLSDGIQLVLDGDNFDGKKYKGTYVVDERNTTMTIDGISAQQRVANIYLVRVDMDVIVEKQWSGAPTHFDDSTMKVTVELQHQHVGEGEDAWHMISIDQGKLGENGAPIVGSTDANGRFELNKDNKYTVTFHSLPKYLYDSTTGKYDLTKELRYRTIEIDPQDSTRLMFTGETWISPCGHGCSYIVSYQADYTEDNDRKITITNTYVGSYNGTVVIGKRVSGTTDRDKYFNFKVVLDGTFDSVNGDYITVGDIEFKILNKQPGEFGIGFDITAEATIQIKAGGAVFLSNLPLMCEVSIEELLTEKEKGFYKTTITTNQQNISGDSVFEVDPTNPLKVTGTVYPAIFEIIYTNHREAANPITLKKEATGNMADDNTSWRFAITIDEPYNQHFGGLPFTVIDGYPGTSTALVWLKPGESIDITGLPDGISYTIRELRGNLDGFTTTVSKTVYQTHQGTTPLVTPQLRPEYGFTSQPYTTQGVSGMATLEYDDTIVFNNHKDILVDTGIVLDTLPYVAILGVVAGVGVFMFVRHRKKEDDE